MIFKKFFTLILLLGFSLSINATPIVGWIDDFEGEPADYSLMRGKQPLPIEFFTPLQNGDKIEARHSQHRMTLKLGDTQSIKISQKNSPYFVNSLGKVPTQFDNLLTWVGEWITIWFRAEKEVGWQVSSNVKSGASEVPYMKLLTVAKRPDLKMQITRGSKPLYLAWAGGTPPYHIEIKHGQKTLISLEKLSTGRRYALEYSPRQYDDYRIILSDAKHQPLELDVQVS